MGVWGPKRSRVRHTNRNSTPTTPRKLRGTWYFPRHRVAPLRHSSSISLSVSLPTTRSILHQDHPSVHGKQHPGNFSGRIHPRQHTIVVMFLGSHRKRGGKTKSRKGTTTVRASSPSTCGVVARVFPNPKTPHQRVHPLQEADASLKRCYETAPIET